MNVEITSSKTYTRILIISENSISCLEYKTMKKIKPKINRLTIRKKNRRSEDDRNNLRSQVSHILTTATPRMIPESRELQKISEFKNHEIQTLNENYSLAIEKEETARNEFRELLSDLTLLSLKCYDLFPIVKHHLELSNKLERDF